MRGTAGKECAMKKPELLLPAGSPDVLRAAVKYGADAVYIGGEYSLRAKAKNFSTAEMAWGIRFAHSRNVKVYITLNMIAKNDDLSGIRAYLSEIGSLGADALIISDPAVFMIARKELPDIDIHISTQANNTNYGTFNFWHDLGAKRVVCARELSLGEIGRIRENIPDDLEIEAFVHGAMCISYSGRCLLSSYMTGREANRGECTHPCRWKYSLVEEKRPGEYMPVFEDERGTYIFNSKDLCMIDHIPELTDAGIDSFKVEGRMKTALYVATAARTYRMAIDDYFESPEKYRANIEKYESLIAQCTHRQYTTGFFLGKPDGDSYAYDKSDYEKDYIYLGIAGDVSDGLARIKQKNKFCVGDRVEILKKDGNDVETVVEGIFNEEMEPVESAPHPKQTLFVRLGVTPERDEVLRKKRDD